MTNDIKKYVESVAVSSRANGDMEVYVWYHAGTPGMLGRLAVAAEIEDLINRCLKPSKAANKAARIDSTGS